MLEASIKELTPEAQLGIVEHISAMVEKFNHARAVTTLQSSRQPPVTRKDRRDPSD
jgi:hypothetical protein